MAESTDLLAIPPDDDVADPNAWHNAGHALLETFGKGDINPSVLAYAGMGYAWRQNQPASFEHIVRLYGTSLERRFDKQVREDAHRDALQRRGAVLRLHDDLPGGLPLRGPFVAQVARAREALGLRARGPRLGARDRGDRDPHVARGPAAGHEPLFLGALHRLGLGGPVPRPGGDLPERDRERRGGHDRLRDAPDRPPPGPRRRHARDDAGRARLQLLARRPTSSSSSRATPRPSSRACWP